MFAGGEPHLQETASVSELQCVTVERQGDSLQIALSYN